MCVLHRYNWRFWCHFRHKFKANPLNEKVLKNAHLGVKKVPTKELTKPVGFDLETDRRNEVWSQYKQDEEEPEPFHARPVPTAILKGPTVSLYPRLIVTDRLSPIYFIHNCDVLYIFQ